MHVHVHVQSCVYIITQRVQCIYMYIHVQYITGVMVLICSIQRTPFSTPARALLKTMTMTTGEFEYDGIFRQTPDGTMPGLDEIPFPPVSYILWIVFIILMPILLTNLLVCRSCDSSCD